MTESVATRTVSGRAELPALLLLTFFASLGTGILWSGVAFVAKHDFGYSAEQGFLLFTATAVAYIAGAFAAGPVTRAVSGILSPRGVLAALFAGQAGFCLLPLVSHGVWTLWTVAVAVSLFAAVLWPIVESYLTSGRHGASMRSVIGWWNVTWTSAMALSLIGMAPLIELRASLAIVALAPASVLAMSALPWFPRAPGRHEPELWRASIAPDYRFMLSSARVLLPTSYLLIGALSPLMPFRLEEVGASPLAETPSTATWMVARIASIALMWRLGFWHGRWWLLLAGGLGIAVGFGTVVMAPGLGGVLVGLALFGAAQGAIYYAAFYYAMAVGAAAVDAGGTHEGLIGVGYAAGPLAALVGMGLSEVIGGGVMGPEEGIVLVVSLVLLAIAVPASRPYRVARSRRGVAI